VDVSQWDGVVGLERAAEQPFYHMLPDQGDCEHLFGGPRDMRYVAEDNLEALEPWESRIVHPLIPHAFERFDPQRRPPRLLTSLCLTLPAWRGVFCPDDMLTYQYPDPAYTTTPPTREREEASLQPLHQHHPNNLRGTLHLHRAPR
jgi:hemimethylated DNA binding protein